MRTNVKVLTAAVLVASLGLCGLASAITLSDLGLEIKIKFSDRSALYVAGTTSTTIANPASEALVEGSEGRAILRATSIHDAAETLDLWFPQTNVVQLTAVEYGYYAPTAAQQGYFWNGATYTPFLRPDGVTLDPGGMVDSGATVWFIDGSFVSGGHAGAIDMYEDTVAPVGYNFAYDSADAGSSAADEWTSYSTYPTITDDTIWLTGTYVPRYVDANVNAFRDPGEFDQVLFDLDGDGVVWTDANADGLFQASEVDPGDAPGVYHITNYNPFSDSAGSGDAYIDFTGGTFYDKGLVKENYYGAGGYDMTLHANLHGGQSGVPYGWHVQSDDPAYMYALPEPASITLLGLGLAGMGALRTIRRRRSR